MSADGGKTKRERKNKTWAVSEIIHYSICNRHFTVYSEQEGEIWNRDLF